LQQRVCTQLAMPNPHAFSGQLKINY